mmetsp:Transcript_22633/g.49142  ORF Transcript_22633/g.49142 Transcript_22633/m.49142 type:complete len:91 (+) Transcript_22633:266-538(+)
MPGQSRSVHTAIAACFAILAYLPFESIARGTLLVCVAVFVLDPFPLSRVYAVGAVAVVQVLAKIRNSILPAEEVEQVNDQSDASDSRKEK